MVSLQSRKDEVAEIARAARAPILEVTAVLYPTMCPAIPLQTHHTDVRPTRHGGASATRSGHATADICGLRGIHPRQRQLSADAC
jgi:hypothetical protein